MSSLPEWQSLPLWFLREVLAGAGGVPVTEALRQARAIGAHTLARELEGAR
ncbi:MAG TPA: hypothetical protein VFA46_13185 [Actinomycetes bacterium]|jgi:hypothetical protein|nr:hypothetical protein [Actinomycetes bacterium]